MPSATAGDVVTYQPVVTLHFSVSPPTFDGSTQGLALVPTWVGPLRNEDQSPAVTSKVAVAPWWAVAAAITCLPGDRSAGPGKVIVALALPAPLVVAEASVVLLSRVTSMGCFFSKPVAVTSSVSPGAAVDCESVNVGVLNCAVGAAPTSTVPATINKTAIAAPAIPPVKKCLWLRIESPPNDRTSPSRRESHARTMRNRTSRADHAQSIHSTHRGEGPQRLTSDRFVLRSTTRCTRGKVRGPIGRCSTGDSGTPRRTRRSSTG